MESDYTKFLNILDENEYTSFNNVSNLLGWSRYSTKKNINEINDSFEKLGFDVEISEYPRKGLKLEGLNLERKKAIQSMESIGSAFRDRQIIQVLSLLLEANGHITTQELADELFVSKSKFEDILKEVRTLLKQYSIEIIGSNNGIKLNTCEINKRKFIAELINSYKNNLVAYSNPKDELKLSLKMEDSVKQFIDLEKVDKVASILMNFIKQRNLYMTEYEFNSLAIHISISVERFDNNFQVNINNDNENEIKYEKNTMILVYMLEKEFNIFFPNYEKEYINYHILSIQSSIYNKDKFENDKDNWQTNELDKLKSNVKYILQKYEPDTELINDLSIHLKGAINRLKNNISIRNGYIDQIKSQFTRAFKLSVEFVIEIENLYDITFDEDEIGFIAIHIQSFLERKKTLETIDVILVCGSGYGTAKLLEQRLLNVFGNKINIVDRIGINSLYRVSKEDFIITTVPIEFGYNNSIYVSPFLTDNDIDTINNLFGENNTYGESFLSLISEDFFTINYDLVSRDQVLDYIFEDLSRKKYLDFSIQNSVIERENLASTAIKDFAMPHAKISNNKSPLIYVYINKNGIIWGKDKVKIVFLFLLNDSLKDCLDNIYNFFYDITTSELILQSLINSDNYDDFLKILKNGGNK